ncbi:hypothetical protein NW759_014998 [Fusarium solani]|nr:hypothetical protein NW759_014998 [Fusarium solani]
MVRKRTRDVDIQTSSWAHERLHQFIFELDIVMRRIFVHGIARHCPSSLIICLSGLLALQLEVAIDTRARFAQRVEAQNQMNTALAYLRDMSPNTLNARWTLRVYEMILKRKGLWIGTEVGLPASDAEAVPGLSGENQEDVSTAFQASDLQGLQSVPSGAETHSEQWIDDLLAGNALSGLVDTGYCDPFMP